MTRPTVRVLTAGVLAVTAALSAAPAARAQQSPEPAAYIVVDADTGSVIAAKEPHAPLPPASTAKVLTALTAVERLPPDAQITVSPLAAAQPASRINMAAGHVWPFQDALASLMMVSANDAAYAIAEGTSGGLEAFADDMAETGERLGLRDSTFSDPAGFDDEASFGGGPRMSAFDLAITARNALAVPELRMYAALARQEFVDPAGAPRSLRNHNKMLPGNSRGYDGTTGLKTGYTDRAGHTLIATATKGDRSLIVVVLDTYDTYGWAQSLLDAGFAAPRNATGTGERLPDVRVSPWTQRAEDAHGFFSAALGTDEASDATARVVAAAAPAPTTPPASVEGTSTSAPTTTSGPSTTGEAARGDDADGVVAAADTDRAGGTRDTEAGDASGGALTTGNVAIAVSLLLLVAFVARRRAVLRRRARRLVRRRETTAAMRRGSLPVVDGRYRTGARIGPPVESHVRVHRDPEPGDG